MILNLNTINLKLETYGVKHQFSADHRDFYLFQLFSFYLNGAEFFEPLFCWPLVDWLLVASSKHDQNKSYASEAALLLSVYILDILFSDVPALVSSSSSSLYKDVLSIIRTAWRVSATYNYKRYIYSEGPRKLCQFFIPVLKKCVTLFIISLRDPYFLQLNML